MWWMRTMAGGVLAGLLVGLLMVMLAACDGRTADPNASAQATTGGRPASAP